MLNDMVNHAPTKQTKRNEQERDFFCVVGTRSDLLRSVHPVFLAAHGHFAVPFLSLSFGWSQDRRFTSPIPGN